HPVINQIGVDTQNEVVKEEKRSRLDNAPYGKLLYNMSTFVFEKHPYSSSVIGTMEDLDAAQLDEFKEFFKKYYGPNNATLVISGDIQIEETQGLINDYFGDIPSGKEVSYTLVEEPPMTE